MASLVNHSTPNQSADDYSFNMQGEASEGGDNGDLLLIDYRFIESTSAYSSSMLPAVFTFPRSLEESG